MSIKVRFVNINEIISLAGQYSHRENNCFGYTALDLQNVALCTNKGRASRQPWPVQPYHVYGQKHDSSTGGISKCSRVPQQFSYSLVP